MTTTDEIRRTQWIEEYKVARLQRERQMEAAWLRHENRMRGYLSPEELEARRVRHVYEMQALFPELTPESLEALCLQEFRSGKEARRERRAQLKQHRADGALVLEMLAIGRRSVAKRFHPDLGGSTEAMLHLNHLHDVASAYLKLQFGIKTSRTRT